MPLRAAGRHESALPLGRSRTLIRAWSPHGIPYRTEELAGGIIPCHRPMRRPDALAPVVAFSWRTHVVGDRFGPADRVLGIDTPHEIAADFQKWSGITADARFAVAERFRERKAIALAERREQHKGALAIKSGEHFVGHMIEDDDRRVRGLVCGDF